jgi:hypothetical protein
MSYWNDRKHLNYYTAIRRLIESLGPCESILDVGSADTPIATYGEFNRRCRIDSRELEPLEGVTTIQADWFKYNPGEVYSVTVCAQVIEHLTDQQVRPFVDNLFESAEVVIVSVPYLWEQGLCPGHPQDPINLSKFVDLMGGRDPEQLTIERDGNAKRLVALFKKELTS